MTPARRQAARVSGSMPSSSSSSSVCWPRSGGARCTRAGVADTATSLYREKNRDAFASGGDAVWFERDAKGRVTAMHFGSSRVWDFVSVRVP